jgi:hypothetical protein
MTGNGVVWRKNHISSYANKMENGSNKQVSQFDTSATRRGRGHGHGCIRLHGKLLLSSTSEGLVQTKGIANCKHPLAHHQVVACAHADWPYVERCRG